MTPKQKENLDAMQFLGFNTMRMSYDECVEEMIHLYIATSSACEMDKYERFKYELERLKKETN